MKLSKHIKIQLTLMKHNPPNDVLCYNCMCVSASGRTNTSLRGMDYGLTIAVFGYTRNLNKNADLRRQGNTNILCFMT